MRNWHWKQPSSPDTLKRNSRHYTIGFWLPANDLRGCLSMLARSTGAAGTQTACIGKSLPLCHPQAPGSQPPSIKAISECVTKSSTLSVSV